MRASQCLLSPANALRRVFLATTWDSPVYLHRLLVPAISQPHPLSSVSPSYRPFTTHRVTQFRNHVPRLSNARSSNPSDPGSLRDYDIPFPYVQVRLEDGSLSPPTSKRNVLNNMNLEKESLVLLALPRKDGETKGPEYPICRIVDRAEERRAQKQEKAAQKAAKITSKELEINWAIAPHDLKTKMNQLGKFLEKGYKVKVTLKHPKEKNKRRASLEEAQQVLKTVEELMASKAGTREEKGREGSVGGMLVLHLWRPAGQGSSSSET
ncbi:hypothetical protein VTJ04DRAFT_6158 [Mycothermus thermophilus]|uniref:uncharacterized protein n=1 Tax=Humicola insolens TaxID=85995 RepID=UPI003744529A